MHKEIRLQLGPPGFKRHALQEQNLGAFTFFDIISPDGRKRIQDPIQSTQIRNLIITIMNGCQFPLLLFDMFYIF